MKKDCEEIKEEDKDAIHKDFLTKIIGLFGPFHFVVYTTLAMTISLHSWQMMANKFYTYKTDHFCAR